MSPYSYCLNNPLSFVDPTGHSAACTGGGYSLNYPRKNYDFLIYIRNHPGAQAPEWKTAFDINDPISYLFAHLTGMEDIMMRRQLHWDLVEKGRMERAEYEAKRREDFHANCL